VRTQVKGEEAGPPGKRPEEAKAGNCIGMYKKYFINSLTKAALLKGSF
jgi:hypothetical protein